MVKLEQSGNWFGIRTFCCAFEELLLVALLLVRGLIVAYSFVLSVVVKIQSTG